METVTTFLASLPTYLGAGVATMMGLIALDVLLGIALAIRTGVFDWKYIAQFYKTMVLPYLIGFLAFSVAAQWVSVDLLGPEYGVLVSQTVTTAAWLAVVGSIAKSIFANAKDLYEGGGEPSPF